MAEANNPEKPVEQAAASGETAENVPNLVKDEETGEMVSKNELKKRKKMREKEQKMAEKAAKKKADAEAKAAAGGDKPKAAKPGAAFEEEEKDPSKYNENRKNFVQSIRD